MVQVAPEIPEAEAEGKTKAIYDDIKHTLRVPYVGATFRALAVYPDFLTAAWTALKPNAQTVYFERQADTIRRLAVSSIPQRTQTPAISEGAALSVRVLHYARPKFLLATAVIRSATNGEQPRMRLLSLEETRQVAPGVPREAQSTGSLSVPSEDAGHADGGPELSPGGTLLQELRAQPEYRDAQRSIQLAVERTLTALPYRMDINPHVLRLSGLSESDIDAVREILRQSYAAGPDRIMESAFLAIGTHGRDAAVESPFPIQVV